MNTEYTPTVETLVAVGAFAVIYLAVLVRRTLAGALDLYDLVALSTVAVVPAAFAFFPGLATMLAELTGVAFPFIVMFGALFVVTFVFLHRLTVNMHKLNQRARDLTQELSLMRAELDRRKDV